MNLAEALSASMAAAGQRDEVVAVELGVSAQSVMKWRTGRAEPSRANYDHLRRFVPGFADRVDGRVVA